MALSIGGFDLWLSAGIIQQFGVACAWTCPDISGAVYDVVVRTAFMNRVQRQGYTTLLEGQPTRTTSDHGCGRGVPPYPLLGFHCLPE